MHLRTISLLGIAAGKGARKPGAEDGPYELRAAGLVERLTRRGHRVEDLGDIPGVYETRTARGGAINNLRNIVHVNRHTHACVLGARRKAPESFLLVIGGDHSLAIGVLAGLSDACRRLGILWIDAHADFNTPRSSPSGNAHGMSLAVACGRGHIELVNLADRHPIVDESDVCLLGCRDIDAAEQAELDNSAVTLATTKQFRRRGVVSTAVDACQSLARRCDHVHLSFDIDVLDPSIAPGTGTAVPGGLTREEAIDLLSALSRQGLVHSAEFVEYNPALDRDGGTRTIAIELIEALCGATRK
ncbi:Arginase [Phycisphaerae bacterium RAS1]|nr:Arginase [Phycisphaerae bacterium RAS1]